MFNRSIKYIVLLVINIIILIVLYANNDAEQTGVFDTEFVIDLLAERDSLQEALIDAEILQLEAEKKLGDALIRFADSDVNVELAQQRFERCESARESAQQRSQDLAAQLANSQSTLEQNNRQIIGLQDDLMAARAAANSSTETPASEANPAPVVALCDTQEAELAEARQQLARIGVQVEQQQDTINELETLLSQASAQDDSEALRAELEELRAIIAQLRSDIENPIYLKTVYLNGKKCDAPPFEELVCVEEFLVRPQFSKAPTSDVTVSVYSPDEQLIASATFSSKRAQLFRLSMNSQRELNAGEFTATFEVEGELLRTDGHLITH
ncbi:hypothetical protein PN836_005360 [Ningiella sp. W23]|uniref:hypothetical protein n=1 Tax=Ningiella sp. W23 TaxID=3023715 RepID=UPI00375804E7